MFINSKHALVAGLAALSIVGSGAGAAQAVPARYSIESSVSNPVTVAQPSDITDTAATSATSCHINERIITRYSSCDWRSAHVTLLRNGKPVGEAQFSIAMQLSFNQKSLAWREDIHVSKAVLTPNATGIRMDVSASSSGNSLKLSFPEGHSLGAPAEGTASGLFNLHGQSQRRANTAYRFAFTKPGFTPGGFGGISAQYRCDNAIAGMSPGCVVPSAPAEVSMAKRPNIAAGIRALRARGGHWGDPNGGRPLTWIGQSIRQKNWEAVCKGKVPPPADKNAGRTSCDEYPFASSEQGGTALPANQRTITWVPPRENNGQGGDLRAWTQKQRVLSGDTFYVIA